MGGTLTRSEVGGTPSQVWSGGVPQPGLDGLRGTWGNPPARSGWWEVPRVPPWLSLDGGGYLGYPPLDRAA